MALKRIIKEYFSYSTSEKRGLLVLIAILIVVLVIPNVLTSVTEESQFSTDRHEIDSLISVLESENDVSTELFPFDPNEVSVDEMKSLGLKQYQIQNLIKYRERGGVFKKKTDLQKIYGISDDDYLRMEDYIMLPNKDKTVIKSEISRETKNQPFNFNPNEIELSEWLRLGVDKNIAIRIKKYLSTGASFKSADDLALIYGMDSMTLNRLKPYIQISDLKEDRIESVVIELNSADSTMLKKLPGIGWVLSKRIIKYRNLLGGYSSVNQLNEVYGVSDETFNNIREQISVNSDSIKQISVNESDAKTLSFHPYISSRTASDIIKYRNRNGKFNSIDELNKKKLLTDSLYRKLLPYLNVK